MTRIVFRTVQVSKMSEAYSPDPGVDPRYPYSVVQLVRDIWHYFHSSIRPLLIAFSLNEM